MPNVSSDKDLSHMVELDKLMKTASGKSLSEFCEAISGVAFEEAMKEGKNLQKSLEALDPNNADWKRRCTQFVRDLEVNIMKNASAQGKRLQNKLAYSLFGKHGESMDTVAEIQSEVMGLDEETLEELVEGGVGDDEILRLIQELDASEKMLSLSTSNFNHAKTKMEEISAPFVEK